jgi:hypothetical protein
LPLGAPGEPPPCIRQRPFAIAGDWHCWPSAFGLRIGGSGARAICFARGCSSFFRRVPSPGALDCADDCLSTGVNVRMLQGDRLLSLSAVTIHRSEQLCGGSRKLVRLVQAVTAALERLVPDHCSPIIFHCSAVCSDQLRRHHAFQLIPRGYSDETRKGKNAVVWARRRRTSSTRCHAYAGQLRHRLRSPHPICLAERTGRSAWQIRLGHSIL